MLTISLFRKYGQLLVILTLMACVVYFHFAIQRCHARAESYKAILQVQNDAITQTAQASQAAQTKLIFNANKANDYRISQVKSLQTLIDMPADEQCEIAVSNGIKTALKENI